MNAISRRTGALSGCAGCEWDIAQFLKSLPNSRFKVRSLKKLYLLKARFKTLVLQANIHAVCRTLLLSTYFPTLASPLHSLHSSICH